MDVEEMDTLKKSDNVDKIVDWLKNEAPFNGRTDASFIINFLSYCSNDVEKTKQRIGRYYELRKTYPKFMKNRNVLDEKLKKLVLQEVIVVDLDAETTQPTVLVLKTGRLESSDAIVDCLRGLIIVSEIGFLEFSRLRKYGCVVVYDLENVSFNHVMQFTPSTTMPANTIFAEGLPVPIVAIHVINAGFILKSIVNVFKFALPEVLRNVLHVHSGGWECVSGRVPAECLPVEYGGTKKKQENGEYCVNVGLKWREYLLDDEKYGYSDDN